MNVHSARPRVVAPPWEREKLDGQRSTYVGREAHVEPEIGPVELYRSRWPTRVVGWNVSRQLYMITDLKDLGWREFVCELDAPPDPESGEPRSPEELAAMVESGDYSVVKVFRDFDYAFVNQRMREAMEFNELGTRRYADKIAGKNRQLVRGHTHDYARRNAARMNEHKRHFFPAEDGSRAVQIPGTHFTGLTN